MLKMFGSLIFRVADWESSETPFTLFGMRYGKMKRFIICGLFCLFIVSISGCTRSVEIIAHRGASNLAPENTMASVMLGWEKGADVEVKIDFDLS